MNYHTYYLDAQTDYLWNGLSAADLATLDGWLTVREFGADEERDLRAADWIRERVRSTSGNFIVLNKKGVHFLYEQSYPPGQEIWSPIPTDYHTQPELVRNAYDNGIRYNVDEFFAHLLPDPADASLQNTVYVYTSDHGQTLFEGGVSWLHCNYTKVEATVPLLILGRLPGSPDMQTAASHEQSFCHPARSDGCTRGGSHAPLCAFAAAAVCPGQGAIFYFWRRQDLSI